MSPFHSIVIPVVHFVHAMALLAMLQLRQNIELVPFYSHTCCAFCTCNGIACHVTAQTEHRTSKANIDWLTGERADQ